jgi:disulfide bond formation protein DsbB|tara:strand:- start:1480 stop:1968 length:489 start_codon:yes stop_codon:yes gene_type:complete
MDKFLKINLFNKILAIIVFASVLFSFFLEFFLNLIPCKLCLYQRYLWLFLLLACIINLKQSSKSRYIETIIIITLCAIITLSFYHSGIEFGFFNNIISCTSENNETVNSIEELDFLIRNTKNMDCAFPKFKIFNLSLSNLSFLFSTSLLLFCLKKYNRNIFK